MRPGLVSACICFIRVVGVSSQEECTFKCNDVAGCQASRYYDVTNGSCTRNSEDAGYSDYLLGMVSCQFSPQKTIHDEATCSNLEFHWRNRTSKAMLSETVKEKVDKFAGEWSRGVMSTVFSIRFDWDNTSEYGCSIFSSAPEWMGLPEARTRVCLAQGSTLWKTFVVPIGGGVLIGLVLAWCAYCSSHNQSTNSDEDKFWLGCKLLTATTRVSGSGNGSFVFRFRIAQVIANAWFPSVIALIVKPLIFVPIYAVLYVLPAFCAAGWEVFRQPIYLLSPPDCSLFGIDQNQEHHKKLKRLSYLISSIRPFVVLMIVIALAMYYEAEGSESHFWNTSGFFRVVLINPPGPLVFDFVLVVSYIGVVCHFFMTTYVLYKSSGDKSATQPIIGVEVFYQITEIIKKGDKLTFTEPEATWYIENLHSELAEQPDVQRLIDLDKTKAYLKRNCKKPDSTVSTIGFIVPGGADDCEQTCEALDALLMDQNYVNTENGEQLSCRLLSPPIVSLDKNAVLTEEIQADSLKLMDKMANLTGSWDASDGLESELEVRDNAFAVIGGNQETFLGLAMGLGLAAIDFFVYIWKIVVFLNGSSYFLAIIIVAALSEAIFTLVFTGAMRDAYQAIVNSFRAHVQTRNFIALVHWDDGLAGVPYLMVTTIYALPLQDLSNWPLVLMAVFFICSGTRAMANFIMAAVDYDMLDVGGSVSSFVHDEERTLLDGSDEESDFESDGS